jgi:hypothetical protein
MTDIWTVKYLKYKNKYLELKKSLGKSYTGGSFTEIQELTDTPQQYIIGGSKKQQTKKSITPPPPLFKSTD